MVHATPFTVATLAIAGLVCDVSVSFVVSQPSVLPSPQALSKRAEGRHLAGVSGSAVARVHQYMQTGMSRSGLALEHGGCAQRPASFCRTLVRDGQSRRRLARSRPGPPCYACCSAVCAHLAGLAKVACVSPATTQLLCACAFLHN